MLIETLTGRPKLRRLLQLAAVVAGLFGVGGVGVLVTSTPAAATTCAPACGGPSIDGETAVPAHGLVRLRADGVPAGAAVLWRVSPRAGVSRATTAPDRLEFAAPPGTYDVELLVIGKSGDGLAVGEVFARVTVGGPKAEPKPEPKPDPAAALGKVRFGNGSCTATVVGPRRPDGRWDVLTASHCLAGVGARGTLATKDGRSLAVRCVVHQAGPDLAWLVTEAADLSDLAHAAVAAADPAAGVRVWHQGYGLDQPGNREDGHVAQGPDGNGQLRFVLSVSPGDSGGGIFRSDSGELVSTVCCTAGLAKKTDMWGSSTARIRAARPGPVNLAELPEIDAPAGCR